MRQLKGVVSAVMVVVCMLAGIGPRAYAQSVRPVPNLDLNRLRGTWYEIAKYPYKPTKTCLHNSFQLIALNSAPRSLQIVGSCVTKRIYSDPTHTSATQVKNGSGEFKIKRLLLFHRTRDVLAIASDDAWFVIGNANHKELWIYSKTATLPDDLLANIEAQTTAQGFDSAKLVRTPQNVAAVQSVDSH